MRQRIASILRIVASCFRERGVDKGFPRLKTEDGTTFVEFTIVCLVLLAMLFGICEFGTVLYAYHFVSHAAKSATRYAAVNGASCGAGGDADCTQADAAAVKCYVTGGAGCTLPGIMPPGIDPTRVNVAASWPLVPNGPTACSTTSNAPGCTVEVTVCYDYKFIFPLMPAGSSTKCPGSSTTGATLTLSSTSEMTIAH
jgi:Flp pilus assembly protein TadG